MLFQKFHVYDTMQKELPEVEIVKNKLLSKTVMKNGKLDSQSNNTTDVGRMEYSM